jgi:hypothetical protein
MANLTAGDRNKLGLAMKNRAAADSIGDVLDAIDVLSSGEADFLDGAVAGTAAASKCVVLDANKDIGTIRHLTINGNLVTGSTTLSEAELGASDGVTLGTSAASKNLTLDANQELDSLGKIRVTDTLITTTEVKALFATPITVVAAPGSGIFTEFLGAYIFMDYATTQYAEDAGDDTSFRYTNAAGAEVSIRADGSLFEGAADALIWVPPIGANAAVGAVTMVDNAVIVIHTVSSALATGDSPWKVRVYHRQIRKAALEAIA